MRREADELATLLPLLPKGRDRRSGVYYLTVPSSDDPLHKGHNTNSIGCSCEGFDRRGICSHALAVAMVDQRAEAQRIVAAQPPVPKSAQQIYAEAGPFGPCISKLGCDQ